MKMVIRFVSVALVLMSGLSFLSVSAHEGHKVDDVILNDLGDLGHVRFEVSCDEDAQEAMNTGVGLLHHMMYAQAGLHFKAWSDKAPDCAMLLWGYSMSLFHPLWPDRISNDALVKGTAALNKATSLTTSVREKYYLNAAAQYYKDWETTTNKSRTQSWADAQALLYREYPEDIDAVAFYALSILVTAPKEDLSFSQNRRAGELLQTLLKRTPTHPGAIHYTIHAYDNPPLAKLAIDAARTYSKIAPEVPHALHMPSHIFVRLGMWDDVVEWNLRSAKAALNYPTEGTTSMHYAHAIDYLVYGYMQLGHIEKALSAQKELATHNPIEDNFAAVYALAAIPARITLEQQEWQQASKLSTQYPSYLSWQNFPQVEAITYFARGLGAARSGDLEQARTNLQVLEKLYKQTESNGAFSWAPLVDAQRLAVQAWIAYGDGETELAIAQLREAADIEDSIQKSPVTPGPVLPIRELLGDMLLLQGDTEGAQQAFSASSAIRSNRLYSKRGTTAAKLIMTAQPVD